MISLKVDLGPESYPIYIGNGILVDTGKMMRKVASGGRVGIITNTKVRKLYGERCARSLRKVGFKVTYIMVSDGERYKTVASISRIYDQLVKNRFDRADSILALGGGVTGDMAGFAASTYMRGITCVQAPTTLLAQVDSSVGGKTGVDHPGGKNLIGTFYQPKMVLSDLSVFKSLSDREFRCGLAEVVKYGIIRSSSFFSYLENSVGAVLSRKKDALEKIVKESCRIKARIVAEDEKESGVRAVLNFGHTFGHGIETALGFKGVKHGEAVAIGMVLAARLSYSLGLIAHTSVKRIQQLLTAFGLPTRLPGKVTSEKLFRGMSHDKKIHSGKPRFILFDGIGRAFIRPDLNKKEILAILR